MGRLVSSFKNKGRELIDRVELHQTRPLTDFFSSPKKATQTVKQEPHEPVKKASEETKVVAVKKEDEKETPMNVPVVEDMEIESVSSESAEKRVDPVGGATKIQRGKRSTTSFNLEAAPDMNVVVKGERVVRSPLKGQVRLRTTLWVFLR